MRRLGVLLLLTVLAAASPAGINEPLEEYRRVRELSGAISIEGSPTVCALLLELRRGLRDMYPGFSVEITASGSAGAPEALLAGRCEFAALSRPMSDEEIAAFKKKFGYEPERYTIARDAIVVLANMHNPIVAAEDSPVPGLTLRQLDSIFSVDRKRGGKRISSWGEVGLTGEWAERSIMLAGVGTTSGTTESFWRMVLQGGRFKATVVVQPGPGAVVNGVGTFEEAIGIVAMEYRSKRTRAIPLAATDAAPFALPTLKNCLDGKYPLVRDLYLYVNRKPGTALPDLLREALTYICSEDGQNLVVEDGLIPIDLKTSTDNLKRARATK